MAEPTITIGTLRGRLSTILPANQVYVGRPVGGRSGSPLANPFKMQSDDDSERDRVIQLYDTWLAKQIDQENEPVLLELQRLANLAEKNGRLELICWCAPKRCHAEVIRVGILAIIQAQREVVDALTDGFLERVEPSLRTEVE